MDVYIWLILLSAWWSILEANICNKEPKCRIRRIYGMKGADCFKRDIRNFPQCLSSGVEIIDLSFNRIRKLTKTDLKKYTDLKMLYLSDNVIISIDPETFEDSNDLNTLDLSLNAIVKLPPVVFHLPSLKSLYLGQNLNMNIVDSVEQAKPLTSPLLQLDISYVMSEDADELPDLGIMPHLTKYNISGNKLSPLSTKHLAGLCNLKILDTANVSAEFNQPCDCWTLNWWLQLRKVQFVPFKCDIAENLCEDEVAEEDLKTYAVCMEINEAIIQKSRLMKILIPLAVITVLLIFGGIYFVMRRRKRKLAQMKNRTVRLSHPDGQTLISD